MLEDLSSRAVKKQVTSLVNFSRGAWLVRDYRQAGGEILEKAIIGQARVQRHVTAGWPASEMDRERDAQRWLRAVLPFQTLNMAGAPTETQDSRDQAYSVNRRSEAASSLRGLPMHEEHRVLPNSLERPKGLFQSAIGANRASSQDDAAAVLPDGRPGTTKLLAEPRISLYALPRQPVPRRTVMAHERGCLGDPQAAGLGRPCRSRWPRRRPDTRDVSPAPTKQVAIKSPRVG